MFGSWMKFLEVAKILMTKGVWRAFCEVVRRLKGWLWPWWTLMRSRGNEQRTEWTSVYGTWLPTPEINLHENQRVEWRKASFFDNGSLTSNKAMKYEIRLNSDYKIYIINSIQNISLHFTSNYSSLSISKTQDHEKWEHQIYLSLTKKQLEKKRGGN